MSFTRAQVIQRARDLVNSEDINVFTPLRLYRLYNELRREWAIEVRGIHAEHDLNVVQGQNKYDLRVLIPAANRIQRVRWRPSSTSVPRELPYCPYRRLLSTYGFYQATALQWSSLGLTTLVIDPIPSSTIVGALIVDTYDNPPDLDETTATNNPDDSAAEPWPDYQRPALAMGMATKMAWLANQDTSMAARWPILNARYEQLKADAANEEANPGHSPIVFASDDGYGAGMSRFSKVITGVLPSEWGTQR